MPSNVGSNLKQCSNMFIDVIKMADALLVSTLQSPPRFSKDAREKNINELETMDWWAKVSIRKGRGWGANISDFMKRKSTTCRAYV